jgi:hypothetical protein
VHPGTVAESVFQRPEKILAVRAEQPTTPTIVISRDDDGFRLATESASNGAEQLEEARGCEPPSVRRTVEYVARDDQEIRSGPMPLANLT